jgi:hypothetical protein
MPNLGSSRAPLNIMTEIVIIFFIVYLFIIVIFFHLIKIKLVLLISQDCNLRHRVFLSNVFVAHKHYFL